MTDLTLTIPDAWWMTSNQRLHWADKAKRTFAVRHMAAMLARARRIPRYEVVHVTAFIQYPTGGRADPGNASPTVKAAIDGLVDAGIVADDTSAYMTKYMPRILPPEKGKPPAMWLDVWMPEET